MDEHIAQAPRQAGFPGWTQTPIPGVSLSAGGLLALADLTTVAQRTAIKGGSSWLDSLLLVPGLHYQQAADEIARSGGGGWSWGWDYGGGGVATAANTGVVSSAGEGFVGMVNNSPMMMYLNKVVHQARERGGGEGVVFLDVGALGKRKSKKDAGRGKGKRGADEGDGDEGHGLDLGWLSHWLYLMSPILTIAALVMLILVEDWWALGCILTLMISRILNIWVIKQRARKKVHFNPPEPEAQPPWRQPSMTTAESSMSTTSRVRRQRRRHERQHRAAATNPPTPPLPQPPASLPPAPSNMTQITITLPSSGGRVRLRGSPADLHAVTTETWMRAKTRHEGYLEAAAKLLVYLVAAVSGNWTQAGAIVVMVLLLASAGLLALSNGCARGVEVNGRIVAAGSGGGRDGEVSGGGEGVVGDGHGGEGIGRAFYNNNGGSWGGRSQRERPVDSGAMDDWAERGMAAEARKREEGGDTYPSRYPPTRD
ncbi:hypothetical protein MCOR14_004636 [Pyricularia oryzae]|uniref:Uncharacterized protein n=1 Tax=Pyricularia grisea TaxID=148305 RepID=A0ABQ8NJF8_PYRGI|nr:hypothetical protein MCOR26_006517 [Pyricularia oryzae]KAI6298068.1 hypothetical protein MCOR33_005700 [Pyricularia grisea]KAI6308473.1 hypothetical protein MCOR34_007201 [Pyricularia oryzae]KAI6322624.1 hypothetical protein MCOR30_007579 [Pyricularia oryzae]KAI6339799.1 hypothetical protein MCOR28_007001 [Pyricularia oryzae]